MKFYVFPYQHKSEPFRAALLSSGHEESKANPDIILADREWYIQNNQNAVVAVYPHSALPPWWYDGLIKLQDNVKCVFVIGEGQKRAMKIISPNVRVETTGWPWSELVSFQKPAHVKKILFAPIHPAGGRLRPEAIEANNAILNDLLQLSNSYKITIRYVGNRFRQGVGRASRLNHVAGIADGSTKDIDEADLVIAEGTMMYLSVARGKPTIGINQHLPMRGNKKSDIHTPHNWDRYGDGIGYPINYGSAPLDELIARAADCECSDWRNDFIGDKLSEHEFAAKVENIWRENVKS